MKNSTTKLENVTVENTVANEETKQNLPKETTPKISKFEKVTSEFIKQNNIDETQLYKYLLKKSVGKKTNLNDLAEGLMNDSFFNREKLMAEING